MMKTEQKVLLGIMLIAFFALTQYAIFGIDSENWFDTAFSIEAAHQIAEGEDLDFRSIDVHPPTYYHLLAGWSFLNPGLTEYHWARELSVLIGLIFCVWVFFGLTRLFGTNGSIAALILSTLPTYMHYGTEARSYILVMAMSAYIFWAITRRLKGPFVAWSAFIVAGLLPVVQYIAAMAIPFYMLLWYALEVKEDARRAKYGLLGFGLVGVIGVAVALFWAIPQMLRGQAMWFVPVDIWSFPAALGFAVISIINANDHTAFSRFVYFAFTFVTIGVGLVGMYVLAKYKEFSREMRAYILMGATSVIPFVVLVGVHTLPMRYVNIYHHRFFLLLTWMFVAVLILMIIHAVRWLWDRKYLGKIVSGAIVVAGIVFIIATHHTYAVSAHHELQNVMRNTPCETAYVGHESAFSYIPFEVHARERNCDWTNFVSTDLTWRMAATAGYDIIPEENKYWNNAIPKHGFYYIQSSNEEFNLTGRNVEVLYDEDGVDLLNVSALQSTINVEVLFGAR